MLSPPFPPRRHGASHPAPPAAPPAAGGFRLLESAVVARGDIPTEALRRLVDYWEILGDEDALPCLRDVDPNRAQVLPGRVHLVRVEGDRRFRFLHYGVAVTNPDARDMSGKTTADYEDRAFATLVTDHYQEAVAARAPVCRAVRATHRGETYDYLRVVAPFALDDDSVAFLLIATHRLALPSSLERQPPPCDPVTLRQAVERTRRLALQVAGTDTGVALAGLAAAAALHFAEATLMATGRSA